MFKKLKDKLAEEVKSSPQRIQLFAQAAQAAVTSASSSISDITNSDLFSIGDNDSQQPRQNRPPLSPTAQHKTFQDVSLMQSPSDSMDFSQEMADGPRQRRLSNSSFASDISFRLPSYETPSMYHLQSDMEVSASEADDRGFSGGPATLERVTKEQLYAAYKRTQERYKKYRTQYGDLARHYKLLERENAKARSVLVETQDKALRRISELKEQCSLEQSAKAHLEKALRVEIEEKGMKIEALNTKVQFLQNNTLSHVDSKDDNANKSIIDKPENDVQLINLDNESNVRTEDYGVEVSTLNNKIDKMEQLLNKYKESLKSSKEKNSQLTTELQILSKELENKDKQISELKISEAQLSEAKSKIQELNNHNEELQNQINSFDFNKTKEQSTLELDLQKANDEIAELRGKIEVFNKREEEYAISLAENKLSIHKELEGKEAEIKSLKDILSSSKKEMQSLKIVVDDYKNNISVLEEEKVKLSNECAELNTLKNKLSEMDSTLQELSKKSQALEQLKTKADEEYKCLQLQLKQETAEKLAMIDRNTYLETKNSQISEENVKKNTKISSLESQLQVLSANKNRDEDLESEKHDLLAEIDLWKQKCSKLELEIQDEREELVKLQTEIEKLLLNHELIQTQNAEFRVKITNLTSEIIQQQESASNHKASINFALKKTLKELKQLKNSISETSKEAKTNLQTNEKSLSSLAEDINNVVSNSIQVLIKDVDVAKSKYDNLRVDYDTLQTAIASNNTEKTENISKFEDLLKENENLKLKLTEKDSYIILANQKLEDSVQKHDSAVHSVESLKKTNEELTKKLNDLEKSSEQLQLLLDSEKAETIATVEKIKSLNTDKQKLDESIQALEAQNKKLNDKITQLKEEHKITLDNVKISHDEIMKNKEEIIKTLTLEDRNQSDLLENIHKLDIEKNELNDTIKSLELHNKTLQTDVEELNAKHEAANIKLNELNKEMTEKADILVKTKQELTYLQNEVSQHANTHDTISELEHVKQNLLDKLKLTEDANEKLKIELAEIKEKHNATEMQIQEASLKVIKQSDECAAKQVQIHDLEERIRNITQENICLQSETVNFASSIKKLESEIEEIKISHAEMETEKDRLNRIIEELEGKQKEDVIILKNDQDSQTEAKEDNLVKDETSAILENKWVMEHKQTLSSTASLNLKKENLEDLYEQYSTLKMNYDTLKDENRRLQSDIEGLQSYLTKISKENSVLNDKLRESIASSENSSDSDQLSTDVKELRNEIQLSKEKINDLQRENSLLVEENLELRDQLQSQNYAKPAEIKPSHNDSDLESIKVKYNELLQANSNLEKQNIDLEQINKSVNSNMQQIQEKNERLKLSNEKLERRLDEALVSLRHLHSLQENTELEYLRNILYEYLTGSGTHSVTLAKVLAAIVKFDDVQTQLVLQKEKERQGFLRQLGII